MSDSINKANKIKKKKGATTSYWRMDERASCKRVLARWKLPFPVTITETTTNAGQPCLGLLCDTCTHPSLENKAVPRVPTWADGGCRSRKGPFTKAHADDEAHKANLKALAVLESDAGNMPDVKLPISSCGVDVDVAERARRGGIAAQRERVAAMKQLLRIAHYIAKEDLPYTAFPKLRALHVANGVSKLCIETGVLCNNSANYTSDTTVKELQEAMAVVCSDQITKEIHASPTRSILVDESVGEDGLAHLLIYMQYIKNAQPVMKLLGEITMTLDNTALTDWVRTTFPEHLSKCAAAILVCLSASCDSDRMWSPSFVGYDERWTQHGVPHCQVLRHSLSR
jgi:hypothetical protein